MSTGNTKQQSILNPKKYPAWAELLNACQSYASKTGGRFQGKHVQDYGDSSKDCGIPLEQVMKFKCALMDETQSQKTLRKEAVEACQYVFEQGVLHSMRETCKIHDLLGPRQGVTSTNWKDTDHSLIRWSAVIHNHFEQRRANEQALRRDELTANFISDFCIWCRFDCADNTGMERILGIFLQKEREFTEGRLPGHSIKKRSRAMDVIGRHFGNLGIKPPSEKELKKFWDDNKVAILIGAGAMAVAAGAAIIGSLLAKKRN